MSSFITFVRKEITESLRTKRVLVISCVFLFFAISGPLLARYIVEFLGLFAGIDELTDGLLMALPAPHWSDAYTQFYANIGQVGALTIMLVFIGIILREKRTGTADLVLTKGLSPTVFVLSKFTVAAGITIAITFISLGVSHIYTLLLFDQGGDIGNVLLGGAAFSVFLIFLLGITVMLSAMAKSTGTGAVLGIVAYFIVMASTVFIGIGRYSPGTLMMSPIEISIGHIPAELPIVIFNSIVITAISLWGAVVMTARRQV